VPGRSSSRRCCRQVIGRDTKATLIGAAIGAAIGGLGGAGVGKMMDNQERDMREALAASEAASLQREGNLIAISLKGDVTFDTDSTVVRPGLYSEIDRIANVLVQYQQTLDQSGRAHRQCRVRRI